MLRLRQGFGLHRAVLLIVAIAASLLAGAVFPAAWQSVEAGEVTAELSAGLNVSKELSGRAYDYDGGFKGGREVVNFSVRWTSDNEKFFVELRHTSHIRRGPPFNNKPEDFLDQFLAGYRFSFNRR